MKNKITLFVGCVAVLISGAAAQCDKIPADFNIEGCCKFPEMGNEATVKKVAEAVKELKLDPFMSECKISEGIFKEMKLTKDNFVDKDLLLKNIDSDTKDAIWKPIMKNAGEECFKDISAKKDEIAAEMEKPPFNIKKDQCNTAFMSLVTCIHLEGFENCPKENWKDEKRCTDGKAWIVKCGDNIDSMRELANKSHRK